jgi:hypothetical protein
MNMKNETKNADGHTFRELYDAAADKETEVKPMNDFTDWYKQTLRPLPYSRAGFIAEMRKAYEAGAASQAEDLRDKFAGQALAGLCADPEYSKSNEIYAARSYKMADAMLEARKVQGKES